eukprot:750161-Hanusia_phi.AAC.1
MGSEALHGYVTQPSAPGPGSESRRGRPPGGPGRSDQVQTRPGLKSTQKPVTEALITLSIALVPGVALFNERCLFLFFSHWARGGESMIGLSRRARGTCHGHGDSVTQTEGRVSPPAGGHGCTAVTNIQGNTQYTS